MTKSNKQQIMSRIKSGKIKIKSRFNILSHKLGLGSGVVLAGLLLVFTVSGLIYWIRTNQDLATLTPGYGYRMRLFFLTFPYLWLMAFVLFFIFLSFLLKKYDFSYKKPFIMILALIIALISLLSIVSYQHPLLANYLRKINKTTYLSRPQHLGFVVGQVKTINNSQLILTTKNNQEYIVLYDKQTVLENLPIKANDFVRAIGKIQNNELKAEIIINLNKQKQFFPITPYRKNQQKPIIMPLHRYRRNKQSGRI